MKIFKKFLLVMMCCFAIFSFVACDNLLDDKTSTDDDDKSVVEKPSDKEPEDVEKPVEDLFQSYSPCSIKVDNMTNERLYAFKGSISASTLISGIPADVRGHSLKLDTKLFNTSGDFALYLLTEEQYLANKDDLTAIRNSPFAIVYAFYDKNAQSTLSFPISSYSGGSAKLTLNNSSAFNCEIRINSPEGEILGYVGGYEVNKTINIQPGDYTFYPVFKKFVKNVQGNGDGEIYSFVPKFKATGKPYNRDFAIETSGTWDLGAVYNSSSMSLSTGGFYITINNQSATAVRFKNGSDGEFATSIGIYGISDGTQKTFFIPFERQADGSYPEQMTFSQLNVGGTGYPNYIPSQAFKLDTRYIITVSGEEKDNLTLSEVEEDGLVDVNGILGL